MPEAESIVPPCGYMWSEKIGGHEWWILDDIERLRTGDDRFSYCAWECGASREPHSSFFWYKGLYEALKKKFKEELKFECYVFDRNKLDTGARQLIFIYSRLYVRSTTCSIPD